MAGPSNRNHIPLAFGDQRRPATSVARFDFRSGLAGSATNPTTPRTGYFFDPNRETKASTPSLRPSTYHGPPRTFRPPNARQQHQDLEETSNDASSQPASSSTIENLLLDPDQVPECIIKAEGALAELRAHASDASKFALKGRELYQNNARLLASLDEKNKQIEATTRNYRSIIAELKENEAENLADIESLRIDLDKLQEEHDDVVRTSSELQKQNAQQKHALDNYLNDKNDELAKKENELTEVVSELKRLESEHAEEVQRVKSEKDEAMSSSEKAAKQFDDNMKDLARQKDAVVDEARKVEDEYEVRAAKIVTQPKSVLSKLKAFCSRMSERIDVADEARASDLASAEKLRGYIKDIRDKFAVQAHDLHTLHGEHEKALNDLRATEKKVDELKRKTKFLQEAKKDLKDNLAEARAVNKELATESTKKLRDGLEAFKDEHDRIFLPLKRAHDDMKSMQDSMDVYVKTGNLDATQYKAEEDVTTTKLLRAVNSFQSCQNDLKKAHEDAEASNQRAHNFVLRERKAWRTVQETQENVDALNQDLLEAKAQLEEEKNQQELVDEIDNLKKATAAARKADAAHNRKIGRAKSKLQAQLTARRAERSKVSQELRAATEKKEKLKRKLAELEMEEGPAEAGPVDCEEEYAKRLSQSPRHRKKKRSVLRPSQE